MQLRFLTRRALTVETKYSEFHPIVLEIWKINGRAFRQDIQKNNKISQVNSNRVYSIKYSNEIFGIQFGF